MCLRHFAIKFELTKIKLKKLKLFSIASITQML
jgi:hypothetical protein